jgi:hypothetical protein
MSRDLQPSEWRPFFDGVSSVLLGKSAAIEVASLGLGDQILAERVPMLGISYDSHADRLDLMLDRTSHVIEHPERVAVDESASGVTRIAIMDRDGQRHVVTLTEPLALGR